jgi:hypothetical protein
LPRSYDDTRFPGDSCERGDQITNELLDLLNDNDGCCSCVQPLVWLDPTIEERRVSTGMSKRSGLIPRQLTWSDRENVFRNRSQQLGNAPCLSYASCRPVWRISICHFRDMPETGHPQMFFKRPQPTFDIPECFGRMTMCFQVRRDERSH